MATVLLHAVTFLGLLVVVCHGQSVANNLYDALTPLGCTKFLAILNKCDRNMQQRYMSDQTWTLIAPNDTAFALLPPTRQIQLLNMTQSQSEEYIKAFTLDMVLQTTRFRENQPQQSRQGTRLFFKQQVRRQGNAASGQAGPTEYYVNGARVVRENVIAGRSIVHVIDRVLDVPYEGTIRAFLAAANQPGNMFYREIMNFIPSNEYTQTVDILNNERLRFTIFVPTEAAIRKIPSDKLDTLRGDRPRLNDYVRMHIIQNNVTYTSFVYHNQGIKNLGQGLITFRTSSAREAVFVSSGGVTAQVTHGNITCKNGVVHFIDTLLGYKYYSAWEQIMLDKDMQTFEEILLNARKDIQDAVSSPLGITVFVPTNQAFRNIPSYMNYRSSISLINEILELGMVETGQTFEVSSANGNYEALRTLVSRFNRRLIKVYSQGNETWIESGYVKARVVKPDIGVTNGFIQVIDAVPGVPSRDVPNTIFCESWLIKPAYLLHVTGLNEYMRDVRITGVAPCTTSSGVQSSTNVYDAFSGEHKVTSLSRACGSSCRFTIFVPNGTAVEFFENMASGIEIQKFQLRLQHVLKRHITREIIYLEETAIKREREFIALNGDTVRFRRSSYRYAHVYFNGKQAEIIHSDIAGTNGVIHIIDQVIFVEEDVDRGPSTLASHFAPSLFTCFLCFCMVRLAQLR